MTLVQRIYFILSFELFIRANCFKNLHVDLMKVYLRVAFRRLYAGSISEALYSLLNF